MIAKLIRWCVGNRAMVVMLTLFVLAGGIWSTFNITVDAIPDLSDVQVIIRTEYPGQAPQIVEDQVTYPLTTAMLAVPHADVVRGYSMFGTSFVYIIFEDGTDMYWARSRVLEQLNFVSGKLPPGVSPQLGPDATGVGWIYAYVLVTGGYCPDHPNGLWHDPVSHTWFDDPLAAGDDPAIQSRLVRHRVFPEWPPAHGEERYDTCPLDGRSLERSEVDLSDLRGLQDWYLRYELTAVDGVSEVAAVGGFVKQYQVVVDPVRLLAYDIPLGRIKHAIRRSNVDVGGRLIEMSETEFMVRGMGYLGTLTDAEIAEARAAGRSLENARTERALDQLGKVSLGASPDGRPIYLADLADVRLGPEIRRGIAEWNGAGEAVGGIIVMRFGGNARDTINNVRSKLAELETGLPPGVGLEVGYDRSDLITRAVGTVRNTLIEEIIVVSIVIILFLLHARSALVAVFVLPTGVLASLAIMDALGINANIMSLGGIAISIGVMVDSAVVMVENAHKHLEREKQRVAQGDPPRPRSAIIGGSSSRSASFPSSLSASSRGVSSSRWPTPRPSPWRRWRSSPSRSSPCSWST
jgi:Cu(I)/Ag(I) efflux system membrane protein CusA/SilA